MWVCKIIDHDLPVVCETKEEAIEILNHWNKESLEDEGEVSEDIFDFTFPSGNVGTITSLRLTCEGYEEDNPYAQAFLQNYKDELLKDTVEIENIEKEFHPVFAQQDNTAVINCMRTKTGVLGLVVLKQIVSKNIPISTQTDVYDWISNNVEQDSDKLENYPNICDLIISNVRNLRRRCMRLVNRVIIGENIKNLLMANLGITEVTSSGYENHEIVHSDSEVTYLYDNMNRINPNSFIMCVNSCNIDSSGFIVDVQGKKYLNPIEDVNGYTSFDDYIRIVNVN